MHRSSEAADDDDAMETTEIRTEEYGVLAPYAYVVDAEAVAAALLERLSAGRTPGFSARSPATPPSRPPSMRPRADPPEPGRPT